MNLNQIRPNKTVYDQVIIQETESQILKDQLNQAQLSLSFR